jgi:hypothetical protein
VPTRFRHAAASRFRRGRSIALVGALQNRCRRPSEAGIPPAPTRLEAKERRSSPWGEIVTHP